MFRLGGLAYLLGLASLGVVLVWELVAGIGLSFATIFGTGLAIEAAAVFGGRRLGRRLPTRPARLVVPARLSLLSALFGGRKVDLRTPEDLSRYFRDEVVAEAEVAYAQE